MTSTLSLTNSAANDGQRDRDLSRAGAARACFRVCQVPICQARRLAARLGGDPEEAHGKPRKNYRARWPNSLPRCAMTICPNATVSRKNLILDALACAGHQDETPAKSWHWHRLSRKETHRRSRAKHAG